MSTSSLLKQFFSIKKKKKTPSETTGSGVATPHGTDDAAGPLDDGCREPDPAPQEVGRKDWGKELEDMLKRLDEDRGVDQGPETNLMVLDVAIEVVTLLKEASEASSVLMPLKAVCGSLLPLLQTARGAIVKLSNFRTLMERLDIHLRWFETEVRSLRSSGQKDSQIPLSAEFLTALQNYLSILEEIRATFVERAGKPNGHFQSYLDGGVALELNTRLEETYKMFMNQIKDHIRDVILTTSSEVARLREFRGSTAAPAQQSQGVSQLLDRALDASGERVKPLAEGTRISLIERLSKWGRSQNNDKPIFWLHDEAGTGKSAMAAHMSNLWRREGRLAARFFFNKDGDQDFWTLRRFCPSLAKEMASHHPFAQSLILTALEGDSDVTSLPFPQAFDLLITSTAHRLSQQASLPLIFVIDALDECEDDEVRLFIQCILATAPRTPNLRFLVTGRPTKHLKALLDGTSAVDGSDIVLLDVKNGDAQRDADTSIYIRRELSHLPDEDQDIVIECAKGLFLWATLACNALKQSVAPDEVMRKFKQNTPGKPLARLYEAVLDSSLPRNATPREIDLLHTVLQGVTLTYAPISIYSIQTFYPENKDQRVENEDYVNLYVKKLGSIMKDGTPYLPIYLLHPTFREFLESQTQGAPYYISPPQGHHSIVMACLDLLGRLTPDVYGGVKPDQPFPTHDPIQSKTPMLLPLGEDMPMRYAITFWPMHAGLALQDNEGIRRRLAPFLATTLLAWIEWSSALEKMTECIDGLRTLRRHIRPVVLLGMSGVNDITEKWCVDSLRFLLRNSYMIENCGLQAWMSALVFTPKHSLVYQAYHHTSLRPLPVVLTHHADLLSESRVLAKWRIPISYASFSPDGKRLLTQSGAGCDLWNPKTAEIVGRFEGGHVNHVTCATWSSDGSLVATGGRDFFVCLFDGYTGTLMKKYAPHHDNEVKRVVFALADTKIVSLPNTGPILRWDVKADEWISELSSTKFEGEEHAGRSVGLAASPDGKLVASFSRSETHDIRLWDVEKARLNGKPMPASYEIHSGAFSMDGKRFVAGYSEGVVIIWDIATQIPLHQVKYDHQTIDTIVVSPDKRIIATCGACFCLLDINTGELACPPLKGHSDDVWAVAFNKSGSRMLSGSHDKTVRVWDLRRSGTEISYEGFTLRGHTDYVNSLTLTPDGRLAASVSGDGTLRLWDTDLLDRVDITEPADHVHDRVRFLVLSSDSSRLLSVGYNGTLQMWDFTTGEKVGSLLDSGNKDINHLSFASCGRLWATGHSNGDVCLWMTRNGDEIPTSCILHCHSAAVTYVTFTPDSTRIVTGSEDCTIGVWSTEDNTRLATFVCLGKVLCITISPDGKHMVGSSKGGLYLWVLESQVAIGEPFLFEKRGLTEVPDAADYIVFSQDSSIIATSQKTVDRIRLFEVHGGLRCFASMYHRPEEYRLERLPSSIPIFSPDGKYIFYTPKAFEWASLPRERIQTQFPAQAPEASAFNPVSSLVLLHRRSQIHSRRWNKPVLLIPPDIGVKRAPSVAFQNTIAFGTVDGRVFIVRFPEGYI